MKTIKFFAACALVLIASLNVNAAEAQFIHNDIVENGKVTGTLIYSMDNDQHLTPITKFEYTYEGDAIASKKGLHWNEETNTWENRFLMTIDNTTKICTYAVWVKKDNKFVTTQTFDLNSEMAQSVLNE